MSELGLKKSSSQEAGTSATSRDQSDRSRNLPIGKEEDRSTRLTTAVICGIGKKRHLGLLETSKADVSIAHKLIGLFQASLKHDVHKICTRTVQDAFS
ncbi:uncharacterized protein UDID_19345 [Ustilago sp. UG-2017a]|nr:uncharacterized protein UDID_19345 [Ustilago sp. UG-2017a]SPC66051.1 uncharacterized protein UHOD_11668 [Ustilago sp. UG-2017b]